jgi:hypothetical protein
MGVGLQYFPIPQDPSYLATAPCDETHYNTPDVPIAALPDNAQAIVDSINKHPQPGGATPTVPALSGALDYALGWQKAHPDHKTIVVFATDGQPGGCGALPNNPSSVTNAVTQAANKAKGAAFGNPHVLTFVIGVGPEAGNLNQISQAGSGQDAFFVDTSTDGKQQFMDALNKIRGSVLGCNYKIPTPASGRIDPNQINAGVKTGDNDQLDKLVGVGTKDKCDASSGGWYFDDATNPTQVILCDATCSKVASASKASIDIVYGCKTNVW